MRMSLRRSELQGATIYREKDVPSKNGEGRVLQAYSTVSAVH